MRTTAQTLRSLSFAWLLLVISMVLILTVQLAQAADKDQLITAEMNYQVDGVSYKSYVIYSGASQNRRPGVLIAPEWWGLTHAEHETAKRLARKGYVAMVVDLYGEGFHTSDSDVASRHLDDAQKNPQALSERFNAAYENLIKFKFVRSDAIAAIGFGLGGGVVVDEARRGLELRAAVDFYGGLNSPTHLIAKKRSVRPEILVLVGSYDPYIEKSQITSFTAEMKAAQAKASVEVFPETYHDFARLGADDLGKRNHLPLNFSATASEASWRKVDSLLQRTLSVN